MTTGFYPQISLSNVEIAVEPNPRILVVDDNPAIHEDFRKILQPCADKGTDELSAMEADLFGEEEPQGETTTYILESVDQGIKAVDRVRDSLEIGLPYSVAFVDMRMPPGWDGVKTIKEIWKLDSDLQIVICTAFTDYTWAEITSELGPSEQLLILRKPVEMDEIRQTVDALTRRWQHRAIEKERLSLLRKHLPSRIQQLSNSLLSANGEFSDSRLTQLEDEFFTELASLFGVYREERNVLDIGFEDLREGHVLAADIVTLTGTLLAPRGQRVSERLIQWIECFLQDPGIESPIRVADEGD